jgi:predicted nuclease of predicted toxin-antitoxin system
MRLLANENFPADAIEALRKRGHDVTWIRTGAPGSTDHRVLERAQAENRIPVTFDRDLGELAFRAKLPSSSGVVLFRISVPSSEHITRVAVQVLESRTDWSGHFSVI